MPVGNQGGFRPAGSPAKDSVKLAVLHTIGSGPDWSDALAPAFAAGNCSVLKPASPTPWSILKLAEVIGDLLPPGGSTSPAGYLPGLHRPGAGPDRDDPAG